MATQKHALRAQIVSTIVDIPTILYLFPLVSGLGFAGGLGSAIVLSLAMSAVGLVAGVALFAILGMLGIMNLTDQRQTTIVGVIPIFLINTWLLTVFNGHFGLSVTGLSSAFVGALILGGMSCYANRILEHIDE